MRWTLTHSLDAFESAAAPFLRTNPAENTVPLTICAALRRRGMDAYGRQPPRFGWCTGPGGRVEAAFLQTPPHPPLLTRGTAEASRRLAGELNEPLDGVRGDREAVLAFADAWRARTGADARVEREMRLYALGTLTPKEPAPPGAARVAGPADRDLLLRWQQGFAADVGEPPIGGERAVDDAIAHGGRTLWETGGEPVAMAGVTPPEGGAVRVVAVYTPARHRGRGYAGAVTAAVSRAARQAGARHVVLFADLGNPVSNGLYQRLGYVPVRDHASVVLTRVGERPTA